MNCVSTVGHTSEPALFNVSQIETLPVTATQLAQATRTDKTLSSVYQYVTKDWPGDVEEHLNTEEGGTDS